MKESNIRADAEAHWEYTEKIIQKMMELVHTVYVEVYIHAHGHGKEDAEK